MMQFLPLILMFVLFVLNVPVAYSLLISGMSYFIFINNDLPMDLMIQSVMSSTTSYPMLAIPFFITAGVIMSYSGISEELMNMAEVLTGHMRGGLGQVNVLLSTFMGGISGSPIADCAFESKVLVPEMEKKGFSKGFAAALTAASSVITPIIPPGICLILYATTTNQSIGDMFLAGYVPGILMCAALMITVYLISKKRNYVPSREKATLKEIGRQAVKSIWALLMHFGIIMCMNITIGGVTPPFGILMFTAANITKVKIGTFIREALPFLAALLIVLLLITFVPQLPMFFLNIWG